MSEKVAQKGHPAGLMVLFFSEMWERFCYYGMRALLLLYLVDILLKGDNEAFLIYGSYTALVYMAPVAGGMIADKLLGYKNAVIFGGILMAIGEFLILGGTEAFLFLGMGAIIVGNGYFKANISSIVGKLYEEGDPRRDAGFTIFYIGINIGALLATLVCAQVGETYGYHYGFALAGIGMILGTAIFIFGSKRYREAAMPPDPEKLNKGWLGPLSRFHVTILASLAIIPAIYFLIKANFLMPYLLGGVGAYVVYNLINAGMKEGKIYRDRMIVMIILFVFNIAFWACFEQAGSSLTLFAKRNVDRAIFGGEMAAAGTQFFNPAYIILFGSIFSLMWVRLSKIGKNPNIPTKFGLGIVQLGLGYLIVTVGGLFISDAYLVPLWTLAILYLLHTTGELFLSPIGLSMVTKLAPKHMTGSAMGGWFLSFAASNYVAAILAMATGVGHGGGGDSDAPKPSYDQLISGIEKSYEDVQIASKALTMTSKDLVTKKDQIKTEDEMAKAYPGEIQTMSEAIMPTLQVLHGDLFKFVRDTTTYKGDRPIKYYQMAEYYSGAIADLAGSLNKLNDAAKALASGKEFESESEHIDQAVVGIGESYKTLNGKVASVVYKEGTEVKLPDNVDKAFTDFETESATLSSHVYWSIYSGVYLLMGLITIGIGLLLVLINKPLNKMMHGVE